MGVSRSMTPTVLPRLGARLRYANRSIGINGSWAPQVPQAPIYLGLRGLEVDGPPPVGVFSLLLLLMLGGLSSGPTLIDGNVGGYDA